MPNFSRTKIKPKTLKREEQLRRVKQEQLHFVLFLFFSLNTFLFHLNVLRQIKGYGRQHDPSKADSVKLSVELLCHFTILSLNKTVTKLILK